VVFTEVRNSAKQREDWDMKKPFTAVSCESIQK